MRFLIDECITPLLETELRARGYDCTRIMGSDPERSDSQVLARSFREGRILISEDRDFGALVFRNDQPALGIVAVYFQDFNGDVRAIIRQVADRIEKQQDHLGSHLTVIEANRIRIRGLPQPASKNSSDD